MTTSGWRLAGIVLVLATPWAVLAQTVTPSFDCSKATTSIEKLICRDEGLAKIDRKLSDLYKAAEKNTDQAAEQKKLQTKWLAGRNACSKASNAKSCVQSNYERRIVEIQIQTGLLTAPKPVNYSCAGMDPSQRFVASFYEETEPPSVVLTYGNDQVIAFIQRSGSGAKFQAPNVEFWEHQGEAMVTWRGKKFKCQEKK